MNKLVGKLAKVIKCTLLKRGAIKQMKMSAIAKNVTINFWFEKANKSDPLTFTTFGANEMWSCFDE